jgi:RNA polymerase sigma factor (sigma-70 family)
MTQRALKYLLRDLHTRCRQDLNDGQLLERFCAAHEEAAFTLLVQRHGPMVFAVCRRNLCNLHDAEDAFQATFLVLVRKARSIRKRESLASWLHGVARRIALRAGAQATSRQAREKKAAAGASRAPADPLWEQELRCVLDEEIEHLPPKYRAAVVLCYLAGKTYDQAAAELGWPKSSLSGRLERARRLLCERLTRRGLGIPAIVAGTLLTTEAAPAAVPARLTLATVRAVAFSITGKSAATMVAAPKVAWLTESAVSAVSVSKLKLMLVLMLLVAATGSIAMTQWSHSSAEMAASIDPARTPLEALNPQAGDAQPDQRQETRTDHHGDPLPPGAISRLGTQHYRVGEHGRIAFERAGKTFVSGIDGAALLWHMHTGKILRRFPMPGPAVGVAISPDGKTVAACGASGASGDDEGAIVRIWDTATGAQLRELSTEGGNQVLLLTSDGKLARPCGRNDTCLWDLATGKLLWKRPGLQPVVFSEDGATLVGTAKDNIVFLEAATGRELRRFVGPKWTSPMALSPDCRMLAAPRYGDAKWAIQLWDTTTGKLALEVPGLRSSGEHFTFSPDGKMLAWSSRDKSIRLLDVSTGKELRRVACGLETARLLTYFQDGTLGFCLWNEDTVRVWDLNRDRELYPLDGHRGRLFAALYMPDSRTIVSASMDNTIRWWDLANGKELHRTEAHHGGVWSLALTHDGKTLASASANDPGVRLWDAANRKETGRLPVKEAVFGLAFTADGRSLLTANPGGNPGRLPEERANVLRLWDVATSKELRRWHTMSNRCPLALSPDGRFVASENQDAVIVWDAMTGRQFRRLPLPAPVSVNDLAFSPDGRTLVTAQRDGHFRNPQSAVRFWELATAKERLFSSIDPAWGQCLAYSPDGRYLAVGGERKVHVLDATTGEVIREFTGHHRDVTSLAFAPDGKSLASGSADTTILIWKIDEPPQKRLADLSPGKLKSTWDDLRGPDAANAHRAIGTLSAARQTVAYLAQRLKPIAAANPARLEMLTADLDSEQFALRDAATEELVRAAELAEPALRKALVTATSLEFRRRVEALIRKLEEPITSPETVRLLRSLEVLERVGTPDARTVLQTMATGTAASMITQTARDALQRLSARERPH